MKLSKTAQHFLAKAARHPEQEFGVITGLRRPQGHPPRSYGGQHQAIAEKLVRLGLATKVRQSSGANGSGSGTDTYTNHVYRLTPAGVDAANG